MQKPHLRADIRFLPYLQVHEFEALLFSDPHALAASVKQERLAKQFEAVRRAFPTPEDIDDDANKAPCKRILGIYPGYQKVIDGTLAARAVGIAQMRAECPHFNQWIQQLEALA